MSAPILTIDRSSPFDVRAFIGEGWYVYRGPYKPGVLGGLDPDGKREEDEHAVTLTEIDFAKVHFVTCLEEHEYGVTGEEKLLRHARLGHIRLDAKVGQCLLKEKEQKTLEWIYEKHRVTWFELPGTTIMTSGGGRYFLTLRRVGNGRWERACSRDNWGDLWLGQQRSSRHPSAVILTH